MDWNFLLIAVLLVFTIMLVQGYRKGFLRIVVSMVGIILVIAAVTVVSPYVSDFLMDKTSAYEVVRDKVGTLFEEDNAKRDNTNRENQDITIESYSLPQVIKNALHSNNNVQTYKDLMVGLFEEYIAGYLSRLILKASSFVGVFAVLGFLLWLALRAADLISKIPVLKGLNRFLGLLVGGAKALTVVWIFFLIVVMCMGNDFGKKMMEDVERSAILTFLFNQNILLGFIT